MIEEIEILDGILKYLLKNGNTTFYYIKEDDVLKNYLPIEVKNNVLASAFIKLEKDGYLNSYLKQVGLNLDNTPRNSEHYNIPFEGMFFIKKGGYAKQNSENLKKETEYENIQTEQRKQAAALVRLNRWLVFGAIVVAIDSSLNILNFFGVYFDTSNFLFCIKPT